MGDSKKGGRPRLPVKKERRVSIRLTDAEFYILMRRSREAGMNLAQFIRDAAIKANIIARPQLKDHTFFREVIGISTNLNQVARAVNRQELLPMFTRLKEIIDFFDGQIKRLRDDQ
ncbi:plasmid mobilization protein [Chitinophaga caseinilytica]|uniref:plasmid mobilization protein n=1 Tax=Chitinophaga caseinilytica TaxID=2267521 RepID=UPI003C2B3264